MKKLPLWLLLTTTGLWTFSQETATPPRPASPKVQFGIKAGVNIADIKSELYDNRSSRINFHGGALAHIHINDHLALQPEIVYSGQGFKQDISSGLEVEFKSDYLNIPVLVQYMNSGFRVQTGPQIGFLINAKGSYTDGRPDDDLKEYLKSTDFSWAFGVSYLSSFGLGIDARYNLGITNVNEKFTVPGINDNEMNHRVWQFGIFYQFGN